MWDPFSERKQLSQVQYYQNILKTTQISSLVILRVFDLKPIQQIYKFTIKTVFKKKKGSQVKCANLKPIIIKHDNKSYFKMQTTQRKIIVQSYLDSVNFLCMIFTVVFMWNGITN